MTDQAELPQTTPPAVLARDLRVVLGRFRRRLREEAQLGDFTPSQASVVRRLERDGPSTVTALADADGVRPQSMGSTVAALQAAGVVQGAPDPADGRQTILSLAPVALESIRAGRAIREDWLARTIVARLGSDEQTTLADAIGLLERLIDA